jgi:Ras-related protein Rab-5C
MSVEEQRPFKVVFLGDAAVGKTTFFHRLTGAGDPDHSTESACQAPYTVPAKSLPHDTHFSLWDTAGQERFHSLVDFFAKGAHGAIVMFDLTSVPSFERAKTHWVDYIQQETPHVILFGNKADLDQERRISYESAVEEAASLGVPYMEGSARNGWQLKEAMESLAERIEAKDPPEMPQTVVLTDQNEPHSESCC